MKEVGKVYSAVDADELEVGDIVQLSDYPRNERSYKEEVIISGMDFCSHFVFKAGLSDGIYAKLICPKKHAGIYWAFKNGAKIKHKIPALRQWYPTDNPSWAEDEEFRIVEPAHDNSEQVVKKNLTTAWSFKENKWVEVEKSKTERFTNRELAMWYAKGNGEVFDVIQRNKIIKVIILEYDMQVENKKVLPTVKIRMWNEEEWHEPLKVKE